MLKYKCLIFDHDDTVVKSTEQIHYPSFVKTMKILRPEINYSFEKFSALCFDPGFFPLCTEILKLTPEEMELETAWWKEDVSKTIPNFFEGITDIIKKQKENGGIFCVVSHSLTEMIIRDYKFNNAPLPDAVYGWELPTCKRKPCTFAIEDIISKYNLEKSDILVLDDLKPGLIMAKNAGVDFAGAAWCKINDATHRYMKNESDFFFESVPDFEHFLFGG